jgi:hypothetical protein
MPKSYTVTYDGTSDAAHNQSELVEVDDVTLEQGVPEQGLSEDQVARLKELPYHRFTVEDSDQASDGLDKLKGDELDQLAADHHVDLSGAANKAEKVLALRDAGVTAEGGS